MLRYQIQTFLLPILLAFISWGNVMSQCSISLGNNISICQNAAGTIMAIPTGGTVSAYSWSNATSTNPFTIPTAVVATTTYTVTATFTGGCTATASISVAVNAIPIAAISPASPTICNGQSTSLTASGGGTYSWSNLATTAAATVSPVTTTTYTVTVTNANNCTASASVIVTVNPIPVVAISPAVAAICNGATTTLTASGGATYAWNTGPTTAAITVSPVANTTYTVTVTNSNGCTASGSRLVTVNPKPAVTLSASIPGICIGGSTILTASATTSSGTITSYAWSSVLGNVSSGPVSPITNTTYTVTVTNSYGCTAAASAVVVVSANQTDATLTGDNPVTINGLQYFKICANAASLFTFTNVSLTAATNTSYTINWGDATPNFTANNSWGSLAQTTHVYAIGIHILTYTVIGSNGCISVRTYRIFVGNTPSGGITNCGNNDLCSPDSACFIIGRTDPQGVLNPPGTTYTITYSDGSPPVTYTEPVVPASIKHTFLTSSCGHTFNGVPNTWGVTINILNPCGPAGGTAFNVYTTVKPVANFTMPITACANTSVVITDTSTTNTNASLGACTPDPMAWKISPMAGVTLNSGNLGFVIYSPSFSVGNGSTPLNVTFSQPGIYNVTHYVFNSACGVDSIVKTICILPTPIAAFTLNPTTGCAPLQVATTNTSNTIGNCLPATYSWTVAYAASPPCGNTSSWSFTGNTSAASLNPTFVFNTAGTYTVTLTVTNMCGSNSVSHTVIVKKPPLVNITPVSDHCGSYSFAPTATATNCGTANMTYTWSSVPTGFTSTIANPNSYNFTPTGVNTINLSVTNECGTTPATTSFTIYTPPTVTVPASFTVCAGVTVPATAFSSIPAGATYTWTNSNTAIGLGSGGNGNIPSFTATNTGTTPISGTIIVTPSIVTATLNGCAGPTSTYTITVNPQPTVNVNSPSTCIGVPVTLTATGTSNTYAWSPAAGLSATTGASVTVTNPTANTTYTVTGTITATGCTNTATANIAINPLPVVNAGPSVTLCNQPTPYTLTGYAPTTGGTGVWTGAGVTSAGVFTPSGVGTFILTYTFTDVNSCVKADTMIVSVIAPQIADAGTGFSICVNAPPHTLTGFTPVGGIWSGSGVTGNSFNPAGLNGSYTLTYSFGSGTCLSTDNIQVTVNPQPTVNVNSPSTCFGVPVALTATGTSNTYSWNPAAGLSATTGATVTVTNPTANTSYTVTGTITASGCTNTATANIAVNPLPVVNAGPSITLCNQPIANTLTGYSPTTGGTGVWTGAGVTSAGVFTPSGVGTFILTYTFTDVNSCVKADTMIVSVIAPQIADAGTGFSICVNAPPHTLTGFTPVGGIWSGSGVTGNSFNPAGLNGSYTLTYSFGSGTCLSTDNIQVTVNPQPTVNVNSPSTCFGVPVALTATGTSNTYSWNPAAGLSATTGATVTVTNPTANTSYTVTGTITASGCTNTATANIAVNPLPVVNAGPSITLCNQPIANTLTGYSPTTGGTGVWTGAGVTSAGVFTPSGVGTFILTYTFTDVNSCVKADTMIVSVIAPQIADAGTGFSICVNAPPHTLTGFTPVGGIWSGSGVTGNSFNPAGLNGSYTLTYSFGSGTCLSTDNIQVTVNPQPTVNVNSPSTCFGVPVALTATGTSNTYSWNPAAGLSATTGATVTVTNPTANTSYTVTGTITASGCTNTATANIAVNPLPVVNAGPSITLCNQPIANTLTGYSPTTGGTGVWTGAGVTSAGVFTPSGVGTFILTYTFTDVNSCVKADTMIVSVIAPQIADAGTGFSICINTPPHTLTGFTPANGTWSGAGVSGNTFDPVTAGVSAPSFHILTYSFGTGTCLSIDTIHVVVNPLPTITVNPSVPSICFDDSITLSATGANTYSWSPSLGLNTTTGATVIAFPSDTSTYIVSGINTNTGCANTTNVTVIVFPRPVITNNPLTAMICSGHITSLVALTATVPGTTYTWTATFIDGVTGFSPTSGNANILPQTLFVADTLVGHLAYHITPIANGCIGTPVDYVFTVNPTPIPILPPAQTICNGDTSVLALLSSNMSTATISWNSTYDINFISGPTASSFGNIPPQIIFNSASTPQLVTYHVKASFNGCDSILDYVITVNPSPTAFFSSLPDSICSGQTAAQNNLTSSTPNAVITWTATVPSGILGADTSGTTFIPLQTLTNTTFQPLTIIYYAKATTTGGVSCPGVVSTDTLTVKPKADIVATSIYNTICSASSINIQLSSHVVGTTFTWTSNASPFIQGNNSNGPGVSITDTLINSGTTPLTILYTIHTVAYNCPGHDTTISIVVNPVPIVQFSPGTSQTICDSGTTQLVQITSPTTGVAISWTSIYSHADITGAIDSGGAFIPAQTLINHSDTVQQIIYSVSVGYLNCPGLGNSYIVNVNPTPHIINSDTVQNPCSDDSTIAIHFVSNVLNTNYTWSTTGNPNLSGYLVSGSSDSIPGQVITNSTTLTYCIDYTVIPIFAGCSGVPQIFTICTSPRPVITLDSTFQTLCTNSTTIPVVATSNIPGTTFIWTPTSATDTFITGVLLSYTGDTLPSHVLVNTSTHGDTGYVYYTASPAVGGCSGAGMIDTIQVKPIPGIDFVPSKIFGCSDLHVSFYTDSLIFATTEPIIFNWGDGTPNDTLTRSIIPPNWGQLHHTFVNDSTGIRTFDISLTAHNDCGYDTVIHTVTVLPDSIEAFMGIDTEIGCEPLTINFHDYSTGSLSTFWCFDYDIANDTCNGAAVVVSPGTTVPHTFYAGTYIVALHITDFCAEKTVFDTIYVKPSPVVDFTYNNNVCENSIVTFTEQATSPIGSIITAFNWQFGDGDSLSGNIVTHTYDSAAVYNACLKVTESTNGCSTEKCYPVTILPTPIVDFTGYDTCLNTQPIQFISNTTNTSNFIWDFGDGNSSVLPNPAHQFTSAGTFVVTLTGSTNNCSDSIKHSFIVYPKPTANFTLPATYLCGIPAQVQLTNTSTGAFGYNWDFGNNTFSTNTNPLATFGAAGDFTVTLVVSNQFNCSDTAQHPIDIYPFPIIQSVEIQPAEGCQPLQITVTANATNGNLFVWNFGDDNSSVSLTTPSATYTYPDTGTYTITVNVFSFLDCGDTAILSDTIKVHISPTADFDYFVNTTVQPIDGTVVFTNQSQNAETYLWNFGDGFSSSVENPTHHYENVDSFYVTLYSLNHFGCEDSISKSFFVFKRSLWVPNAFAPDFGGGNNEVKIWQPIGIGIRTYHAQVFNTWGELLWESTKLVDTKPAESWDGTYHGNMCQQDVYVWKVDAVFMDGVIWDGMTYEQGGKKKNIGSLTLIR